MLKRRQYPTTTRLVLEVRDTHSGEYLRGHLPYHDPAFTALPLESWEALIECEFRTLEAAVLAAKE